MSNESQEYKVARVSADKPREYYNEQFKSTTYYIKVMLEDKDGHMHDKPVTIGKKRADALNRGDTVYGRIVATQYDTDKFQAEQNPDKPGAPYSAKKDDGAIKAEWAIGQAVALFVNSGTKAADFDAIENSAKHLFAMVDRVKASQPDPLAAAREIFKKEEKTTGKIDEIVEVTDEPINLDDIPF